MIPLVAGVTGNPFLLRTMLWFAACNFHAFVAFSINFVRLLFQKEKDLRILDTYSIKDETVQ